MNKKFTLYRAILAALLLPAGVSAQNVGIGTPSPNSRLEVAGDVSLGNVQTVAAGATITIGSRTSSVVISDNGSAAANGAISLGFAPNEGQVLMILNRDAQNVVFNGTTIAQNATGGFIYLNSGWRAFVNPGGSSGWGLTGNASTNPATNYVGTTDATDFVVGTNGSEKVRVQSGGNVGIGNAAPDDK